MQRASIKAYRDTPVNWMMTQGQITKLLNVHQIYDIQFTTISQVTAEQSGLHMYACYKVTSGLTLWP